MVHFLVEPCKTEAAFEARPEQTLRLDIAASERVLAAAGFSIVANARVLLMVRREGCCDASLFPSGRILLKTREKSMADRTLGLLVAALGLEAAA